MLPLWGASCVLLVMVVFLTFYCPSVEPFLCSRRKASNSLSCFKKPQFGMMRLCVFTWSMASTTVMFLQIIRYARKRVEDRLLPMTQCTKSLSVDRKMAFGLNQKSTMISKRFIRGAPIAVLGIGPTRLKYFYSINEGLPRNKW